MSSYNLNAKTDANVFENVSNILAFALSVPKNSQLRGKALDVLDQTLDVLDKVPFIYYVSTFIAQNLI